MEVNMNNIQKTLKNLIFPENRNPRYLEIHEAKQFCPYAKIIHTRIPEIETYKVHCDSLQKFLKQNIEYIYIEVPLPKPSLNGLIDLTYVYVHCKII
jgi:hypothetical protein